METKESAPDALPEFETLQTYPHPLLPDGVHATDEAHFRAALVERFPGSNTRQPICDGYFQFRRDVAALGILATQWLDGSFVEGKQDPNDIDLVSFVDYDLLNGMTHEAHAFASTQLIGSEETKEKYLCHCFLVPACREGHPFYPAFEMARAYWRKWFGQTRTSHPDWPESYASHRKGIVAMFLGEPALAPRISEERSEP
jgi:uncharacterized protein DUF6932